MTSMEAEYSEEKKILPSWLVKSLAWAFIASIVAWVGALQNEVNHVKTTNASQDQKVTEVKEQVDANKRVSDIHFLYIKESLIRIETKLEAQ